MPTSATHAIVNPQGEQEFKLDSMLEDHEALMERMNTWNFQIFDLVDKTGGKTGRILSYVSTTATNQPCAVTVELCFNWLVCPLLINILRKNVNTVFNEFE